MSDEHNIYEKYYLSTEGYYFMYRHDVYNWDVMRVSLYADRSGERVDDIRVDEKSRHDIINHFEASIMLNLY